MYRVVLFCVFFIGLQADDSVRVVHLEGLGSISGEKYWNGDFYEFNGVPYATAPNGRDKFKAPLPVEPWKGIKEANIKNNVCQQVYLTDTDEDIMLHGEEDCLTMNLHVPRIASEDNPLPVIIYVHSGAFSGGSGNMAKYDYLAKHDIIVINFNYRVGALGFACLGTEEIPGNAGLKDQYAALKFVNKHIKSFGGDPNKITLAGFSVGASMAELLALLKSTDGLIHQLVLESGSVLAPFAINRHPVTTATNIAISLGFNNTGNIGDLNEFLLNVSTLDLAAKSKNFFLPNSTFGFAPCIESEVPNTEPILTESPLDVLKKGDFKKIPVLTGYSNMEGISRTIKFADWMDEMNERFSDFLPADLTFNDDKTKEAFINQIKKHYFKDEEVSHNTLQEYVDYFSDSMFKYSIIKSAKFYAEKSDKPVYLYEFTYVGALNIQHQYMDKIKGASHRDQTAYVLDFFGFTSRYKDMDTRDRMTTMWSDFVKYADPTAYESTLINVKWPKYSASEQNYLEIGNKLKIKKDLFAKRYQFWDRVYEKYYWNPTSQSPEKKSTK